MAEITSGMISKAAAGDQDAISALYNLTYSGVYKTVRSMIADEDTALDVVQDSYIKGFQSLTQLDEPENFRAWMKRIAINKAKDHLKKKKPVLFTEMANEDGEEIDFRDDRPDHCPEAVMDRKETARLMQEILATLSEEQRLVIGMFYYEEMSVREIAETLGCSENTVKSRLNYGRKKVEVKVRELEKKGTKLYSLAPLPFLLWLFRLDAQAAEIPSAAVLDAVTAECAAAGATAAGSLGAAAAAGAKALAAKIIAGALAVTVVIGGAVAVISSNDPEEPEPAQQPAAQQTEASGETDIPGESETAISEYTGSADPETAYGQLIADLRSACAVDSLQWLSDPGVYHQQYGNLNTARLDLYHQQDQLVFYYSYADLDGNGTDELIIGEYGPEPHHNIIGIYTFDGTQALEIIECGYDNTVTILADGSIMLTQGTILEGVSYIYSIEADGVHPETIATHAYDLYADAYKSESETLSAQEYYAKYVPAGCWMPEWIYLCGKNSI